MTGGGSAGVGVADERTPAPAPPATRRTSEREAASQLGLQGMLACKVGLDPRKVLAGGGTPRTTPSGPRPAARPSGARPVVGGPPPKPAPPPAPVKTPEERALARANGKRNAAIGAGLVVVALILYLARILPANGLNYVVIDGLFAGGAFLIWSGVTALMEPQDPPQPAA